MRSRMSWTLKSPRPTARSQIGHSGSCVMSMKGTRFRSSNVFSLS